METTSRTLLEDTKRQEQASGAPLRPRYGDPSYRQRGNPWSGDELNILKRNRHLRHEEIKELLPNRSLNSIRSKRQLTGNTYRLPPFTRGEDEEIKLAAPTKGATAIHHILQHRSPWEIEKRAAQLGITLFNHHDRVLDLIGEPLADAIRQRAKEDGISMRRLDVELSTSGYFTNVAALRARRGAGPYMPAIRKAVEFFDAELVTAPDGATTINWKDDDGTAQTTDHTVPWLVG